VGPRYVIIGTIRDDSGPALRSVAARLSAIASAQEPGTRVYAWYVTGDRFVLEEAFDSDEAFTTHVRHGQESGLTAAFADAVRIEQVLVLGAVSDATRAVLGGFGAEFVDTLVALSR